MFSARKNNAGWRIDYFLVSDRLKDAIYETPIHSDILGSDHCPVELELGISCNGSIWKSDAEGTATKVMQDGLPISDKAKKAIISGTACLLLVLGFAAGFFTNQFLNKPKEDHLLLNNSDLYNNYVLTNTAIHYPTYVGSSGVLVQQISAAQAKQMTTEELINFAVQIPELISYYKLSATSIFSSVITPLKLEAEDFNALKQIYPVLAELETREDAGRKMRLDLLAASTVTYRTKVLTLLQTLDIFAPEELDPTESPYINSINSINTMVIPVATQPAGE
jgi:hypothetical protein